MMGLHYTCLFGHLIRVKIPDTPNSVQIQDISTVLAFLCPDWFSSGTNSLQQYWEQYTGNKANHSYEEQIFNPVPERRTLSSTSKPGCPGTVSYSTISDQYIANLAKPRCPRAGLGKPETT